jgi:hypothetical protein
MIRQLLFILLAIAPLTSFSKPKDQQLKLYKADDPKIQYFGRIDFSDPLAPRFWSPGVYVRAKFKGTDCQVLLNDEILGGDNHNYIEIAIDNQPPVRIKLTGKINVIQAAQGLADTQHQITICKNTESGIGYLDFVGIKCRKLMPPPARPKRKIEYIGDSITAGTGMDLSVIPCGKGQWYDQHNAYMSYGARTSRALNAQWQLTAVAGIGMTHSCCDMDIVMPQVSDKVDLRDNKLPWDFGRYQPDVVTICLGQNDGIRDSALFCGTYVKFIGSLRMHYPKAAIICLSSPMADEQLTGALKRYLSGIVAYMNNKGDRKIYKYFFSKRYHNGCGGHPDLAEHQQIADELTGCIKQIEGW